MSLAESLATEVTEPSVTKEKNHRLPFKYIVAIEPLGLLYGSAGRFLSPENLVGRSGTSFPPSAATLSGIFAAEFKGDRQQLDQLQVAGPFWAKTDELSNFYVPLPLNCLIKKDKVEHVLCRSIKEKKWLPTVNDKFDKGGWIKISDWENPNWVEKEIKTQVPWKYLPHLHPRLEEEQRRVRVEKEREVGSLFLENGVQLDPDYCLVYLSNIELPEGWYRFGGEGHLVNIKCRSISQETENLLKKSVGKSFALITPAIWGSNRFSTRTPLQFQQGDHPQHEAWELETLLTERPFPYRHRLGNKKDKNEEENTQKPEMTNENKERQAEPNNKEKLLSRGRYAVSAGTVYILKESLKSWQEWDENWFPKEGYSFKRWGCGLSLPLNVITE